MKNLIILTMFFLSVTSAFAQECSTEETAYKAYLTADTELWQQTITDLQQQYDKSKSDADLLALARGQYESYTALQGQTDKKAKQKHLDTAEKNAATYLENNKDSAEGHALLSSIYGLQIALSPMKGMSLGRASGTHLDKALKLNPKSPFVNYQKGSSLYYTPAMWGGDVDEAIVYLTKTKQLCEAAKQTESIVYLNTLAVLGQAYQYKEKYADAKKEYETALAVAPEFGWVKYQLLPELEKEMK